MSKKKSKKTDTPGSLIADNRKARFNYEILETLECGIELKGTEIKALRSGKATIGESYATVEGGDLMLINAHFPEYEHGNRLNHPVRRPRRLLAHRREIHKLASAIEREGLTLVPLRLYFNGKGLAKILIATARGKKLHDKRQTEKKRDWQRQKARLLRQ